MARTAAAGFWSLGRAGARTLQRGAGAPSLLKAGLILIALMFSGVSQAEPVKGEASFSAGGGYARLVFKLAEDVDAEVIAAGSIVVVRFKRPVDIPVDQLSDAVERLAKDCSISPRQAYRYLEHAQQLKGPVPPREAKLAFTVKVPHSLIQRVRAYATTKRLSNQRGGQPGVARAAAARARAWVSRSQVGHEPVGWSIDLIVCCGTSWRKPTCCWCRTNGGPSAESESDFWNRQNPSRR